MLSDYGGFVFGVFDKKNSKIIFFFLFLGRNDKIITMEQNIIQLIESHEHDFSKTEKILSLYIRNNPEQMAMLSISDLAKAAGVGEASVIRFSKKLGFSGYAELKKMFKDRLSATFSISSRFYNCVFQDKETMDYIDSFIDLQKGYIDATKSIIASDTFMRICNVINESHSLFLFEDGGASRSPGNTLEFWLARFGIDVKRINQLGHRIFDKIVMHSEGDVFLAFCFGKDNSDLLKLLNYCKRNKIPSIVITDYVLGLAAANADFVLELKRGPLQIFHSMSVPVLVAESISLFVSKLRKDIAYRNLSKLDELRKEYDI